MEERRRRYRVEVNSAESAVSGREERAERGSERNDNRCRRRRRSGGRGKGWRRNENECVIGCGKLSQFGGRRKPHPTARERGGDHLHLELVRRRTHSLKVVINGLQSREYRRSRQIVPVLQFPRQRLHSALNAAFTRQSIRNHFDDFFMMIQMCEPVDTAKSVPSNTQLATSNGFAELFPLTPLKTRHRTR